MLFNMRGFTSEALAHELNKYGICVRGGFHCSALGHKTLATPDSGAVRVSFGMLSQARDVDALAKALSRISAEGAR